MEVDVIIVGAGPAGVSAGQEIARSGYEVLILEKECASSRRKSSGVAVPRKCFADLKLPEEIIERECSEVVYHFQKEEYHVSKTPGFVLFDRSTLDEVARQMAGDIGVGFLDSTLVSDVAKCSNGIIVRHEELSTGEMQESQARLVVFADGTSTLANKKFQIGFGGRRDGTAAGAAYELKCPKNALRSMDFFFSEHISPFGYGWIFPRKDIVSVGVMCLLSKMKHDIRWYLDNFLSSAELGSREIVSFNTRLMPQSYAEKLHGDSILAVGDAAGTADPIDGGGISNAIASGKVAGKVAVEALEAGNVASDFLRRYDRAWKETENYQLWQRNYLLQRLALKAGANVGIFLKQMGLMARRASAK